MGDDDPIRAHLPRLLHRRHLWRGGRLLGDIERLPEPIPAKGSLGLWEWIA
jgi:hypothetical protein